MEKVFYKKSLTAKIVLERDFALEAYQEIKDVISTYAGVTTRGSFDHELIVYNKKTIGMIRVSRKNAVLALALNPKKVAKKYGVIDASEIKSYAKYPTKILLDTNKKLVGALELLDKLFAQEKIEERKEKENKDYSKVFYERTFTELFKQGFIKEYVRKYDVNSNDDVTVAVEEKKEIKPTKAAKKVVVEDEEEEEDVYHKVTFTAKLVWCATNAADELYIINNVDNWDFAKAIKMDKVDDNTFTAINFFKDGTKLEFKICRKQDWEDVEKGIWKEEIVNHHYVVVNNDLQVEDLIHNFRID